MILPIETIFRFSKFGKLFADLSAASGEGGYIAKLLRIPGCFVTLNNKLNHRERPAKVGKSREIASFTSWTQRNAAYEKEQEGMNVEEREREQRADRTVHS